MHTQMIEVDEELFQVITRDEDGHVTVEFFHGRDAYDKHMRVSTHEFKHDGPRHTPYLRPTTGTCNSSRLWH